MLAFLHALCYDVIMTRNVLVVAALLLVNLEGIAAAADPPSEHRSKHAQKLIATLDSVGINNRDIQQFITSADSHVDKGYFYLTQQEAAGGNMSLRYRLGGRPSIRQMELHYAPENSRVELSAHTHSVRVSYQFEF